MSSHVNRDSILLRKKDSCFLPFAKSRITNPFWAIYKPVERYLSATGCSIPPNINSTLLQYEPFPNNTSVFRCFWHRHWFQCSYELLEQWYSFGQASLVGAALIHVNLHIDIDDLWTEENRRFGKERSNWTHMEQQEMENDYHRASLSGTRHRSFTNGIDVSEWVSLKAFIFQSMVL